MTHDCRTQDAHGILRLQVVGEPVPYPDGTVVRRVKAVVGGDGFTVLFLECLVTFHAGQVFGSEDDIVQLVSFVVDGLQGGERNVRFIGFPVLPGHCRCLQPDRPLLRH